MRVTGLLFSAFLASPGEVWAQPLDFSAKLPVGQAAASPTARASGGHVVQPTPEIGSYNPATRAWTPDPAGQWVLVIGTAGVDVGDNFIITAQITGPSGTTPTVSFLAPVGFHS